LERLRCKYLAKIELINHQIKKSEANLLNNLSNKFSEAKPVELVDKKKRKAKESYYKRYCDRYL